MPNRHGRDLSGRRALVTGSTRGIGRSIAESLAEAGADVVVHSRSQRDAESVAKQIGSQAVGIGVDLRSEGAPKRLVDKTVAALGGIDILVNNAGLTSPAAALDLTEESWNETLTLNLTVPFLCSQAAARHMIDHGAGVIINVTSVAAYRWPVNRLAYVASKSALRTITEALAGEWAPQIRVNSVAPGYIETAMVAALVSDGHIERRAVAAATPLGRLGQSHEVAQVVTFLCSDDAAYVTGVSIPVDGGWIVKPRDSL